MDNLSFNEQMQAFESQLNSLQTQCSAAEKACIVAETNLSSLRERQAQLIEDCERLACCSIDKVSDYLDSEAEDLKEIMSRLSGLSLDGEITDETIKAIEAIVAEFSI